MSSSHSDPTSAAPVVTLPAAATRRLRRRPSRSAPVSDLAARGSLLELAEQRLRSGSIQEACLLGRQAADRASQSPAVWEFLGRCFMRLGEPHEARQHYKKYLALAPGRPNEVFIRAMIDDEER